MLFPLWWALGLGAFAFPLLAVPMALQLLRRRPIVLPPGFWLWLAFLALNVLSLIMLSVDPPGTTGGSAGGRAVSLLVNLGEYSAATVTLLYVGNLSERELPQRRLVRMLAILFLITLAGGLLGVLAPNFQFTSPVELLLPTSVRSNLYVAALVHPSAAQIQSVLGHSAGRPAAPFGYTNFWGNNLSILLVWFVLWGWRARSVLVRAATLTILAVTVIPVVQSLNRGVWLGLAFAAVYAAVRLALTGKVASLMGLLAAAVACVAAFAFTPLHGVVQERLAHPQSNDIRGFLSQAAVRGAQESPLLGWGGTRKTLGSVQSISVGATPNCPQCGNFGVGSNGQLWYVLFSQGFLGAALFLGFFLRTAWLYCRQRSALAAAGGLVLLLAPLYAVFYNSLPSALTLTFISLGVAWRATLVHATPEATRIPDARRRRSRA